MRLIDRKNEWRKYVLDMCQAVHDFCIKENIKYSLAYGTLIGAYRHNGFIPWDDDFDIMMTREDFTKFQKAFDHPRYRCVTCFNCKEHNFAFSRIIDTNTYSLPRRDLFGRKKKGLGVCIDLYIVDNLPVGISEIDNFLNKVNYLVKLRKYTSRFMRILSKLRIRSIERSFYPMILLCRSQSNIEQRYMGNKSDKVICFAGHIANKMVLDRDLFNEYVMTNFMNREFMTIKNYDKFLKIFYGDWMTPPPENKRIPYHGGVYYTD